MLTSSEHPDHIARAIAGRTSYFVKPPASDIG